MRPSLPLLLALLAGAAIQAGCATRQSMDSAYDRSLSNWQGASEESLRARWGKPASEERTEGGGKWLTYIVNTPTGGGGGGPRIGIGIGGFGGGGHVGLGGGVGLSTPIGGAGGDAAVQTCTTRFLVEGGKVSSWTFDGAGCGANE
jgi:hypothetical protein